MTAQEELSNSPWLPKEAFPFIELETGTGSGSRDPTVFLDRTQGPISQVPPGCDRLRQSKSGPSLKVSQEPRMRAHGTGNAASHAIAVVSIFRG